MECQEEREGERRAKLTVHPGDAGSGLSSVHVVNREDFNGSRDGSSEGRGREEGDEDG